MMTAAPQAQAAQTWYQVDVLGNPIGAWIQAGVTVVVGMTALIIFRHVVAVRLRRWAETTTRKWDNAIANALVDIRVWLLFPAVLYLASGPLVLPTQVSGLLRVLAVLGIAAQLLRTSRLVVDAVLRLLLTRASDTPSDAVAGSVVVLRFIALLVVWSLIILMALSNLNIQITPIIAGLGVGGIAVALAVQSILSDLFASLSILLDKPFVVGDFIIVDDKLGTVEQIGIKTTRVRALSGEQLVFANSDLLNSRIQNFKRMQERRVVFTIGVVYETPLEKLQVIPRIIREAVEHNDVARFDRCHFKAYGAYALEFETVYYVKVPDFNRYMDVQQAINLELFERFGKEGVSFAYPTALHIVRPAAPLPVQVTGAISG
jgi:small-conductance mechanosensitive channel